MNVDISGPDTPASHLNAALPPNFRLPEALQSAIGNALHRSADTITGTHKKLVANELSDADLELLRSHIQELVGAERKIRTALTLKDLSRGHLAFFLAIADAAERLDNKVCYRDLTPVDGNFDPSNLLLYKGQLTDLGLITITCPRAGGPSDVGLTDLGRELLPTARTILGAL